MGGMTGRGQVLNSIGDMEGDENGPWTTLMGVDGVTCSSMTLMQGAGSSDVDEQGPRC